jgi:uncharacterized protein (UPF0147 family)
VTADDSPGHTRRVLEATFSQKEASGSDLRPWHALQDWLHRSEKRVSIPFASLIPKLMTTFTAPRLRRDAENVLALIRAHAVLHQATREKDGSGRVVATLDDYAAVRDLVADILAEGVEQTVPANVRRVVQAVADLLQEGHRSSVSVTDLAQALAVDKSTASRNSRRAVQSGYLRDLAKTKGTAAQLVLGDPMPDDQQILPTVEQLEEAVRCCSEEAAA